MIVIKTKMRRMPDKCIKCKLYITSRKIGGDPVCRAEDYRVVRTPTKGRPAWCPLKEITPAP